MKTGKSNADKDLLDRLVSLQPVEMTALRDFLSDSEEWAARNERLAMTPGIGDRGHK